MLVALAWVLLFGAPLAAALLAERRCYGPGDPEQATAARAWQGVAAGLVSAGVGALTVTVLGTGTTALLLKSAWVRDWLYHGQHLTASAVYGRELSASPPACGKQRPEQRGDRGYEPAGCRTPSVDYPAYREINHSLLAVTVTVLPYRRGTTSTASATPGRSVPWPGKQNPRGLRLAAHAAVATDLGQRRPRPRGPRPPLRHRHDTGRH